MSCSRFGDNIKRQEAIIYLESELSQPEDRRIGWENQELCQDRGKEQKQINATKEYIKN